METIARQALSPEAQTQTVPRSLRSRSPVIPAKVRIQEATGRWSPACAGMTRGLRGEDEAQTPRARMARPGAGSPGLAAGAACGPFKSKPARGGTAALTPRPANAKIRESRGIEYQTSGATGHGDLERAARVARGRVKFLPAYTGRWERLLGTLSFSCPAGVPKPASRKRAHNEAPPAVLREGPSSLTRRREPRTLAAPAAATSLLRYVHARDENVLRRHRQLPAGVGPDGRVRYRVEGREALLVGHLAEDGVVLR